MTAFAITQADELKIAALRSRAEAPANVVGFRAMVERARQHGRGVNVGGFPQFTIRLEFGWEVTYTVEEHREAVPCRHLSMSSPKPGLTPLPLAMQMAMDQFGFTHPLADRTTGDFLPHPAVFLEPLMGGGSAINVIEPMDGNFESLAVHDHAQVH